MKFTKRHLNLVAIGLVAGLITTFAGQAISLKSGVLNAAPLSVDVNSALQRQAIEKANENLSNEVMKVGYRNQRNYGNLRRAHPYLPFYKRRHNQYSCKYDTWLRTNPYYRRRCNQPAVGLHFYKPSGRRFRPYPKRGRYNRPLGRRYYGDKYDRSRWH